MAKLLIAEDQADIRFLLERSLELLSAGKFEVETCANGDQAVERLMSNGVDLLITDIRMPVMDGLDAIRRIREFSDIPIIVVSAYSNDKIIRAVGEAGANRFFAKPPDFYKLASVILKLVNTKQRRQSPELVELYRRLDKLKLQAARHGIDAPAAVLTEIEDLEAMIEAIENE